MRRASLATLVLFSGAAVQTATAQDRAPAQTGPVITATISQSIEADTNFDLEEDSPGTTYLGDTRFRLGVERSTQNQNLLFGFDTALRAIDRADEPFEFTLGSPTGALFDYDFEGANTAFDTLLRYRQRETNFNIDEDDFVDVGVEDDIVDENREDDTRERRVDVDLGARFATQAPSSYGIRFTGTDFSYSDDVDDLTPRRSSDISADWTLRITPVFSTIVRAEHFRYDADNNAETELRLSEVDAGLVYEPDENLRLRAGIGYADRVRRDNQVITEDDQGATVRGDIRYTGDDFVLNGDARLTTAAPDTRLSFNLRARYLLARGALTGRLFNRYTGASDTGTEVRIAGASIGLEQDINTVSRFGLDLALTNRENIDNPAEEDIFRTTLGARYIYDVTQTITAELGYRYRTRNQDDPGFDADGHRVFFTIGKTFQTGI